ncbi:MAG TPA: oligosaccharide flippase family protein [Longimicrobiales bacterium]|nr:oligosaccharide flippase family protein [Longimicrobiales bacterium]
MTDPARAGSFERRALAQGSANIVLQGATLVSKAALLLILARWLRPEDVGVFGLLAVTLAFSMFLVGFDFHAYASREMLTGELGEAPRLFRDQLVFHGLFYLVALPALWLVFRADILPPAIAPVFYALVIAEHACQELQRLLITLSRSAAATLVSFVRGGLWVWCLLAAFLLWPSSRSVEFTAWAWATGCACALILGAIFLRDLDWSKALRVPIDWPWVRSGARAALPFLAASLTLRGALTIDRYALKWYVGDRAVGVYTVYAAASSAVVGFVEAGVIFVLRPGVIAAFRRGELTAYAYQMRIMATAAIGGAVALSLVAGGLAAPILRLLGDPVYLSSLGSLWVLLGGGVVLVLIHLADTMLYVRSLDRSIALGAVAALASVAAFSWVLVPYAGVFGAAMALALGLFMGLAVKLSLLTIKN